MKNKYLLPVLLCFLTVASLSAQNCISGTVYDDLNLNGVQDVGEDGIPDMEIVAVDLAGNVLNATTSAEGLYEFCDEPSSTYHVYPNLASPNLSSTPTHYSLGFVGEDLLGNDFAVVNQENYGTIVGRAYYDLNGNGIKDDGEPDLEFVTVSIEGAQGGQSLQTNAEGAFSVGTLLPGDYVVSVQDNALNTTWDMTTVDVVVVAGQTSNEIRFACQTDDGFSTAAGRVCYDLDGNGINDPNTEPGIYNKVSVSLVDPTGVEVAVATTDAAGAFVFGGIVPADYQIRAIYDPTDLAPTTPDQYDINLVAGPVDADPLYFEPLRRFFRCGMAVSTFGSIVSADRVVAGKDITDRSSTSLGNPLPWTPTDIDHPDWRANKMGEVFGITYDEDFNVYTTATAMPNYAGNFSIGNGDPLIYRIDGTLGTVSPFALAKGTPTTTGSNMIFNSDSGLGNICANHVDDLLYVTNMAEGTIVAISDADHPIPQDVTQAYTVTSFTTASIAARSLWGIAFNAAERRVYFSGPPAFGSVIIYSIAVDGTGQLVGPEVQEYTIAGTVKDVADIAFSSDGTQILTAERTESYSAHSSRVFLRTGGTGSWGSEQQIFVGAYSNGRNSAGGVDFAYGSFTGDEPLIDDCETHLVASGDALMLESVNYGVYGFQISPLSGNSAPTAPAYPTDAADYTLLNSIFVDNDADITNGGQDKHYVGDVEVFDCECDEEGGEGCAESNGLNVTSFPSETGEFDCCWTFDYSNTGTEQVFGVELTLLDGVEFLPGYTVDGGHFTPNYSNSSMTITPNAFGQMANNVNSMIDFCLTNITGTPQYMVVNYLGEDYQAICTDTLLFECAPQSPCMEVIIDSLVCDTAGYKYTIDLQVPADATFPGGIGYIQLNVTGLPAGATTSSTDFVYSPALQAGDIVTLMVDIDTPDNLFGEDFCFIVTAHDNEEERLCCYLLEDCIPFPDCPEPIDPCDAVEAAVIPAYQGDVAACCGGNPADFVWLQDIIGDCTALPCGAEVRCCILDGQQVIVVQDDPALCSDPFGTIYDCAGGVVQTYGGIVGDPEPAFESCEMIYDCYDPQANSECCFDLILTDTFTVDPALITAIQTTIITPGISFSGQSTLNALLNGWSINPVVPNQDLIWTHNSGITPNGVDQYLFGFCVEGTTSTDSIFIEIDWLNQDSVICQDTVAVYCPDCLQIVEDELFCDENGNYIYNFSFVNSSAFDVNAVTLSNLPGAAGPVTNEGTYMLGMTVPPGATWTGSLAVQIDGTTVDEACFDIILRQIIGDDINITCCYVTHCIDLPPCDELPVFECPDPDQATNNNCADVWEPVCGCDDMTYSNVCYALNAGVTVYSNGECNTSPDPDPGVVLDGSLSAEGTAQLSWDIDMTLADYQYFVLRHFTDDNPEGSVLAIIPLENGVSAYSFEHVNMVSGTNTYDVVVVDQIGKPVYSNQVSLFNPNFGGGNTNLQVYAYPNPASELIHVASSRNAAATVEIVGPTGQVHIVQAADFKGFAVPVNVQGLADGVFVVRIRYEDGATAQRRVVKVK